ncbi:MAG: hypothetical protein ONB12_05855 [candidate division KSB1 bacterium]|nr:hypothetical protein [candidate division KSB1 bacterium]
MKGVIKKTALFFLIGLAAFESNAAADEITAESTVDRSRMLIGDVITYTVRVVYDPAIEIQMPALGANLGAFEIRSYEVLKPKKEKGKKVEAVVFHLSTFETGDFEIQPFEVAYRSKSDTTWKRIATQPLQIVVESLNPDEKGDIRDIKPPITPPYNYRALFAWIAASLAALVLVGAAVYIIRRRQQGLPLLPRRAKLPPPAHEIALKALDELVNSDLLAKGEIKEYYSRLSDIIRRYVDSRYAIYAMEMTTTQLLEAMREAGLAEELVEMMQNFLQPCDWVKFAKYIPGEEEHRRTTELAYRFVNETKLVLTEEPSESTESAAVPVTEQSLEGGDV